MGWIKERYRRLEKLCRYDIWQAAAIRDRSPREIGRASLRVLSITWTGLFENHIITRAAALSYASLLGLGPLVALAMLTTGFVINQRDPRLVINTINRALRFIAPQVVQYEHLDQGNSGAAASQPAGAASTTPAAAPAAGPGLTRLIDSFVAGSRSGTAGVLGALTLIVIVIQLFSSVENAFNAVWGVRRGRSWLVRVVVYWTIITLGTILFLASLTALSAAAFINVFFARLPYGRELLQFLQWMLPSLSVILVVGLLTLFYRYIPNTRVYWRSALVGAVVVTTLLFLNNYVAFLYFKRVVLQKSLYGSLGILPVLMLGLYIFWFFVLVGGQISYAAQNAGYRRSQAAWSSLSEQARESLSLLVLLVIGRRFKDCLPPCSTVQLGEMTNVPTQVLNESLNRLVDLNLVVALPPADGDASLEHRYQPARPLDRVTLADFKQLFSRHGENPSGDHLEAVDPVLRIYHERLAEVLRHALGTASLTSLFDEFPAGAR